LYPGCYPKCVCDVPWPGSSVSVHQVVSPGTASVGVVPWGCTPSGYLTYTWQYPVGGLAITRATPTAFVLVPQPRRNRGTTCTQRVPAAGIYPLLAVTHGGKPKPLLPPIANMMCERATVRRRLRRSRSSKHKGSEQGGGVGVGCGVTISWEVDC